MTLDSDGHLQQKDTLTLLGNIMKNMHNLLHFLKYCHKFSLTQQLL